MSERDERMPAQVAEDCLRAAHEAVNLMDSRDRVGYDSNEVAHNAIDRALKAARWAQQETAHVAMCRCHNFADDGTGDCYLDCPTNPPDGTPVSHPYTDSRCAAERDRLRREWKEARG